MVKLSNEKLCELVVGVVKTVEEEQLLSFFKYTDEQTVAFGPFRKISPCSCTTGVKFDFYTNSTKIALSFAKEGKYEIWVEGVICHYLLVGEGGNLSVGERFEAELSDTFGQKKEEYRVTVYFPSHSVGQINYLELDDGAYSRRYRYSRKFLMIGDSITQGWNSKYDSFSYANRISRMFDAECIIQGRGGSVYNENTIVKLENFEPDAVIVAYGTNDYSRHGDINELRRQVCLYHDKLKVCYGDKKVFIITPIWRVLRETKLNFAECCEVIKDEAQKHGFIHIDGSSLMPPISEDFYADGIHPTDLGFSIMAENLAPRLLKYL